MSIMLHLSKVSWMAAKLSSWVSVAFVGTKHDHGFYNVSFLVVAFYVQTLASRISFIAAADSVTSCYDGL